MRTWLLTALLAMGACSGEEAVPEPAPTGGDEEPTEHPSPPPPEPAPELPQLDPETACGRALGCCRAFVEIVPNAVESSACAGPLESADTPDADPHCEMMAAGWGETLRLARGEAPASCGEDPHASGR